MHTPTDPSPSTRPTRLDSLRASILLSLLFLIIYTTTNHLASLRASVPSVYFPWERRIPFVPGFILPYMSIDVSFVAAPFLCRSRRELSTLSRRIIAAILIAGLIFLIWPLRFAFDRPIVGGWQGLIFNNFRDFDPPFNEFPSLHIVLCIVLGAFYMRRFAGGARAILAVWFAAIALSALLTYQHHLIDTLGGGILALLCLHLFQDEPLRSPAVSSPRLGTLYLAGSLALIAPALAATPWSLLLLWPAASLLLISLAYIRLGPGIYRKRDGALPLTTWLLLWPVLLGQRLSLAHYAKRCAPWDRLTDRLFIGRVLSPAEAERAINAGVTAVLDLTCEFTECRAFRTLPYLNIPILDLTAPTPTQIDAALGFIDSHSPAGVIYLHCKIGYSRTAAIAGAYLLHTGRVATADQAIALLRAARPSIVIRPEAVESLRLFERRTATSPRARPSSPPAAGAAPLSTTP